MLMEHVLMFYIVVWQNYNIEMPESILTELLINQERFPAFEKCFLKMASRFDIKGFVS